TTKARAKFFFAIKQKAMIDRVDNLNSLKLRRYFASAGIAGLALCALGALIDQAQFFRSYLLGCVSWLGIALGSLALWMLHNLTGGRCGLVIRRVLESGTRTLPLLAILFLPLAFGIDQTYPWARGEGSWNLPQPEAYLNVPFFLARAAVYFALWIAMTILLNR